MARRRNPGAEERFEIEQDAAMVIAHELAYAMAAAIAKRRKKYRQVSDKVYGSSIQYAFDMLGDMGYETFLE